MIAVQGGTDECCLSEREVRRAASSRRASRNSAYQLGRDLSPQCAEPIIPIAAMKATSRHAHARLRLPIP